MIRAAGKRSGVTPRRYPPPPPHTKHIHIQLHTHTHTLSENEPRMYTGTTAARMMRKTAPKLMPLPPAGPGAGEGPAPHPPLHAPHVRKSALYEHAWVWSSFRLVSTELPLAWHLNVTVTSRCPDAVWQLAPRSPFAQKPINPFVGSCVSTMEKVPPAEVSGSNQCMMTPRQTAGFWDSSNWINEPTCAMPPRMHVRGVSTHGVNVNDWSAAVFLKVYLACGGGDEEERGEGGVRRRR